MPFIVFGISEGSFSTACGIFFGKLLIRKNSFYLLGHLRRKNQRVQNTIFEIGNKNASSFFENKNATHLRVSTLFSC